MPLHRLETNNFKSYQGRQCIGPFTRFTAIVGPNGAGKSNLMDAISFVLGVKSRDLRGAKVEDLIYGARTAHAAKSASVAAIIRGDDNDEESESRFERFISPSGGLSYQINGKAVSWTEYNARLEAINLVVRARNFLVFQGDVESIASMNPKDLTSMFEAICGSGDLKAEYDDLKDKKDKALQLHKFAELKRKGVAVERKQCKEQKDEAERFQALSDTRDALVSNHILFQCFHLERDMAGQQATLAGLAEEEAGVAASRENVEQSIRAKKQLSAKVQNDKHALQKRIKAEVAKLDKSQPELIRLREETDHATRRRKQALVALQRAREEAAKHDTEAAAGAKEQADTTAQIAAAQAATDSLAITLQEEQLEEYARLQQTSRANTAKEQQQLDTISDSQQASRCALDKMATDVEELQVQLGRVTSERAHFATRHEKIQETFQRNFAEKTKLSATRDELSVAVRGAAEQDAALDQRIEEIALQLRNAHADRSESQRNRKMNDAIEKLQSTMGDRVLGKLLNLCSPTNSKFNLAVTVIMGKNMDSIVVDTAVTARECIQHLRESRAGVATFLPLDSVKVKPLDARLRDLSSTSRLARDIIRADRPGIQRIIDFAVENAVVCDTEDEAKYLCFESQVAEKSVSLSGTVIKRSGAMTGGVQSGGKAHLWEEKKVEALKKELADCKQRRSDARAAKKSSDQLRQLETDIIGLDTRLDYLKSDVHSAADNVAKAEREAAIITKKMAEKCLERDALAVELGARDGETTRLRAVIQKEADRIFGGFCKSIGVKNIREYEESSHQQQLLRRQKLAALEQHLAKVGAALVFACTRRDAAAKDVAEHTAVVGHCDEKLEEVRARTSRIEADQVGVHAEISRLRKQDGDLDNSLEEVAAVQREGRKRIGGLNKKLEDIALLSSKTHSVLYQLRSRKHGLLKKCKVEGIVIPFQRGTVDDIEQEEAAAAAVVVSATPSVETNSLASQVAQRIHEKESRIELDFTKLKQTLMVMTSETDVNAANAAFVEEVELKTREMQSIEPNMKAIERLGGVEDRLKDVSAESHATLKANEDAARAFQEIRQRRTEMFQNAFDHVLAEIDGVYKHLTVSPAYAGGTASISLENEDEPFLGGIRFHAMPPLKRFRDMDALSGGEKTIAALALLFAMHSYRQAPFFVLDEIDDALDNTNVFKVARYIDQKTRDPDTNFQCIVISLKQSFFENAESLVGVYREKTSGSSRVLTLDLEPYARVEDATT